MRRKSILAIAVLLGVLFAVGYAEAAERGIAKRTPLVRSATSAEAQVASSVSLSVSKILRARFLQTWKMLADLEEAQTDPPVFGTNGLSDGPDPIDGSGQIGGGTSPPTEENQNDSHGDSEGTTGSSFEAS